MKKTSILLASSIMILAVIVAVVGVTAAWFGTLYKFDGVVEVSSKNPTNNAVIVQGSGNSGSLGDIPLLTPAKIKRSLIFNDVLGTGNYDKIDCNPDLELHPALDEKAVPVTVTFDFVYSGTATNPDGVTSEVQLELTSVTLMNPVGLDDEAKSALVNYRDEFALSMYVTTEDETAVSLGATSLYTRFEDEETKAVYYRLNTSTVVEGNKYATSFDIVPAKHTLHTTLYFIHVDEQTPPELIDAQLFLNFTIYVPTSE